MRFIPILPVLAFLAGCAAKPAPAVAPTLDGLWLTEGYGTLFEFKGDTARSYEVTSVSCLPAETAAKVATPAGATAAYRITEGNQTFLILADSGETQRVRLHVNGAASDMVMRRVDRRPAACDRPTPGTARSTFETFAATWAEHYPFFGLKGVRWDTIVAANRSKITDSTTPQELFKVLEGMFVPFNDAHTFLSADSLKLRASGHRESAGWVPWPDREKAYALAGKHLKGPLHLFCEGQLEFGMLADDIGYLRIRSYGRYHKDRAFESGLVALEAALDTIFTGAEKWKGMVIDVRINTGGADPYGLAIAARLTGKSYVAYAKQARSDPADANQWTPEQPSRVEPSSRPGFKGTVVELIGIQSISAAETFTQALLKREPTIIRLGENTQGVFSDVLGRQLPNGWRFGLPNERFVTDGKTFDGPGIPPDTTIVSFSAAGMRSGQDEGIVRAIAIIRQ